MGKVIVSACPKGVSEVFENFIDKSLSIIASTCMFGYYRGTLEANPSLSRYEEPPLLASQHESQAYQIS